MYPVLKIPAGSGSPWRWLQCNPFGEGSTAGGGDAWFVLKAVGVPKREFWRDAMGTSTSYSPILAPKPTEGTSKLRIVLDEAFAWSFFN